ncbi:protein FAM83B [Coregonus clupeaformis]|uniref:protein FAM83B n=1 Tax=Coregonus clupeaformis TaxID=59861 RepID=UPI001BE11651|nr:protein FAM83B [Coregonus clupeaformis]
MMESQQLSLLSSLKGELKAEDYIHPHYKEAYRLAIDSLVNGGRESYQEFLKAERIGSFLSEDELHFIITNTSQPLHSNHTEEINGPAPDTPVSKSSTGTYWPVHSDIATPDLELGWPEVMHDRLQTNIDLIFHPPRLNSPTIKEVIRKQIQDARQVIAIVMDIFTDVDIFKEAVDASIRGIPVYVLLDEFHLQSFLSMAENQDIQIQKLRNMRVRTVKGPDYVCRSGATFHGAMEQKFLLVDCQTVVYGSYSFMWSYEKINLSMVQVITGQLVESYDEEFRTLFARSSVPAVLAPPEGVLLERNGRHALAKYASQSSQAFERKDQLRHTLDTVYRKACERQTGMTSPIGEMEERFYEEEPFEHRPMINHGVSVQNPIHQFQSAETVNFLKRHSYAGERQEVLYVPHNTRYGASNWNVAGDGGYHCAPGRSHFSNAMEDHSQGAQMYRGHNIRQSYHGNDKQVRSMQQNMPTLEHTAKSFLRTYRIESYLNNTDTPIGESCDYLDQYEAQENKASSFIPSRVRSSLVFKSIIQEQPETNSYSNNASICQVDPSARPNNKPYYSSMQWNQATSMENRMRQDEFIMKKQSLQILDDPRNNIGYGPGRDPHQSVYASLGRAKGGLVIKTPELLQDNWHKRHSVADPKSNIDYRNNKESSSHMYGGAFVRKQADGGGIRVGVQNGGYSSNLNKDQISVSHYDVKNTVDIKSHPVSIWKDPPSRTVSAAALDMNSKEPTYKSTSTAMSSPRFLKKSSKKIRSLLNIPEKKEGSPLTKEKRIPKRGGSSDTIVAEEEEQRPNRETKVAPQIGTANPTRSPTRLKMDKNHFADDIGKSSAPRFSTDELQQNPPVRATSIRTQGQRTAIDERHERTSLASGTWRNDRGGSSRLYSRFEPFCSFEKKQPHSSQSATGPAPIHAPERTKSMHSAKSSSTNEQHNHTGQQTTSHHENKLGKFIQRVGNFIHKNK